MALKNIQVIAAVSDHWVLGMLPLTSSRIQETLNDSRTEFVQLDNVEVHTRTQTGCISKLNQVIIPKRKLAYIITASCRPETPESRWNHHTEKAAFDAFAIVGGCCISGNLHFSTEPRDPRHALLNQLGNFFALTEPCLCIGGPDSRKFRLPLVLANKEFVTCFSVGKTIHPKDEQLASDVNPLLHAVTNEGSTNEDDACLAELLQGVYELLDQTTPEDRAAVDGNPLCGIQL